MDLRAILMGLSFALIWSSAFAAARIVVLEIPAMTALTLRFFFSGVIAIALARALGQSWRMSRSQWVSIVVFGLCQNALYLGLFWAAMQWIDAGLAAIIAATMPLIVAALERAAFGQRVSALGLSGLVAGFVGVALIMGSRLSAGTAPLGLLFCIAGVFGLAVATLALRGIGAGDNVLMAVGLQMLVGTAALAPLAAFEPHDFTFTPKLVGALAYTILIAGILATFIWMLLVERIGPTRAATFHFLNPVFGVAIAAALLGEHLGGLDLVGVAITTAGILAVQLARQSAAPARAGSG